jgi:adenosylmethionine-8-amino-7-oxononanoate aminotransferase
LTKAEKDKSYVWHPFDVIDLPENVFIKKGTGIYLHTNDGRKIIDAISSWWVNIHGHRNRFISNAIAKQLRQLEHVIFAGFTHEPAIRLAENLVRILPGNMAKIFFSDDGSTSVEVALKMAFHYWHNLGKPKKKVVALEGAYHGDTFGAMSVGARGGFNEPFEPYLFNVSFIDLPGFQNLEGLLANFEKLSQSGEVAAFIYEPLVQGSAGMRMYSCEALEKLLKIAKKYEVICIADEVMTGFGRTGKNFASEYCDTKPDIICLSKGLTGGFIPMGVTATSEKIYKAFEGKDINKTFLHGHSYTANPLACAAANESIRILLSKECQKSIARIASQFSLQTAHFQSHPKLLNARSMGCIIALEVKNESDTSYFNPLRDRLYHAFLKRDVLIRPLGNVLYVMPPYIISDKQLDHIFKTIEEVLLTID